jgi:hypothetical protein
MTIRGGAVTLTWDGVARRYVEAPAVLASSGSEVVQGCVGSVISSVNANASYLPATVVVEGKTQSPSRHRIELDPGEVAPFSGADLVLRVEQAPLKAGYRPVFWPTAAANGMTIEPIVERWSSYRGAWHCTRYVAPSWYGQDFVSIPVPRFARRFRVFPGNSWAGQWSMYGVNLRPIAYYGYRDIQASIEGAWLDLPNGVDVLTVAGGPPGAEYPALDDVMAVVFSCEVSR